MLHNVEMLDWKELEIFGIRFTRNWSKPRAGGIVWHSLRRFLPRKSYWPPDTCTNSPGESRINSYNATRKLMR